MGRGHESSRFNSGWLRKSIPEKTGWQRFSPEPNAVAWANREMPESWGAWIWFPEGNPQTDAPAAARFFRKGFTLSSLANAKSARLFISADNRCEAWLNGHPIGGNINWRVPRSFDVSTTIRAGGNLIAVQAENLDEHISPNPAGLMVSLEISFARTPSRLIRSDSSWRVSETAPPDWTKAEFDDASWAPAKIVGEYGDAPWGKLQNEASPAPMAMGLGEKTRLIYAPDPRPVLVAKLRPSSNYLLTRFDPVTGATAASGDVQADSEGNCPLPAPSAEHDWVALLELKN